MLAIQLIDEVFIVCYYSAIFKPYKVISQVCKELPGDLSLRNIPKGHHINVDFWASIQSITFYFNVFVVNIKY